MALDAPTYVKLDLKKVKGPIYFTSFYEKKVGRPNRCRKKTSTKLAYDTKLSKHGVNVYALWLL
jgi:hypothetical protein